MPEVSRFYGIVIALYYRDHPPPHFHAKYESQQATIDIASGEVRDGNLSKRALRLVEEWRRSHEQELMDNWELARSRYPLNQIEPLE